MGEMEIDMRVMTYKNDLTNDFAALYSQAPQSVRCDGHRPLVGTTSPAGGLTGHCSAANTCHCLQGCLISGANGVEFQPSGLERHHRPERRYHSLHV